MEKFVWEDGHHQDTIYKLIINYGDVECKYCGFIGRNFIMCPKCDSTDIEILSYSAEFIQQMQTCCLNCFAENLDDAYTECPVCGSINVIISPIEN